MPRFFFDYHDGDHSNIDCEGLEIDSLDEAREYALAALGDVAHDELPDGDSRQFTITGRDDNGNELFSASLTLRFE